MRWKAASVAVGTALAVVPPLHAQAEADVGAPVVVGGAPLTSSSSLPADVASAPPLPSRRADGPVVLPPLPAQRPSRGRWVLSPGYLLTLSPGIASNAHTMGGKTSYSDIATGHGIELSVVRFPAQSLSYAGAFLQAQRFLSFRGDHDRVALGVQGGWFIVGGDFSLVFRGADDARASTAFAQLGTFISAAFFYTGFAVAFPIVGVTAGRPTYPVEGSILFGIKVPVPLT